MKERINARIKKESGVGLWLVIEYPDDPSQNYEVPITKDEVSPIFLATRNWIENHA